MFSMRIGRGRAIGAGGMDGVQASDASCTAQGGVDDPGGGRHVATGQVEMTSDVIAGPHRDNAQRHIRGGDDIEAEVDGAVPTDHDQGVETAVALEQSGGIRTRLAVGGAVGDDDIMTGGDERGDGDVRGAAMTSPSGRRIGDQSNAHSGDGAAMMETTD